MAQMIVIDGPNIGMMFNLQKKTTIGTDDQNAIRLTDREVGALQAQVVEKRSEFVITNRDKKIEMKINTVPVKEARLTDGDTIEFGNTKLFFNEEKEKMQAASARKSPSGMHRMSESGNILPGQGEKVGDATVQTRQKYFEDANDVLNSLCGVGGGSPAASDKATERLQALFRVTNALSSTLVLDELLPRLLEILFEEFPADRGAILLRESGGTDMVSRCERIAGQAEPPAERIRFSRTVINEVVKTRESILTADASQDTRFEQAMSIMDQKICSVMCIPIIVNRQADEETKPEEKAEVIGVIVLDTTKQYRAFSKGDLELMTAVAMQAGIAIDNVLKTEQMKEQERLQHEMDIAASIQVDLLPKKVPVRNYLAVCGSMKPAKEVGGDYFDFIELDGIPDIYVCIGDVSGKGLPAGLVMVMARCFLKILTKTCQNTRDVILQLNELLHQDTKANMFMTMNVIRYVEAEQRLYYTSGGHEHIVIYRAATKEVECIKAGGTALGLLKNKIAGRLYMEKTIDLGEGDTVFLYTDGVTEAVNPQTQFYEMDRLKAAAAKYGSLPCRKAHDGLIEELVEFMQDAEQHDDITLVVLKRKKAGSDGGETTGAGGSPGESVSELLAPEVAAAMIK